MAFSGYVVINARLIIHLASRG